MSLPAGAVTVPLPDGGGVVLAEEVPVALVFEGVTQAVMMASPTDLEDFLLGFALTERMITQPGQLLRSERVQQDRGIELRGWLDPLASKRFSERRRAMAGPVGCGLCGLESLAAALRPLPKMLRSETALPRAAPDVVAAEQALQSLRRAQPLQDAVRAVHAAGFWTGTRLALVREDVGRHNALDKLAGALARTGGDPAAGALVLTSRLSVDLVQKAAMIGARVLIAPSAPTALAVAEAQAAGLSLIARGPAGLVHFTDTEAR